MVERINKAADGAVSEAEQVDYAIAERVAAVRGMQERISALDERIQAIKEELRALLEKRGSNWADDTGYARIVSEGLRRSYDQKGLDELLIKDPLRYGWLKDYRKETTVRGGVQVK